MEHFQSLRKPVKIFFAYVVTFLLPSLIWGQTGTLPRQVEAVDTISTGASLPSYEDWVMLSRLDTLGLDDYRYHHARLATIPFFRKDADSICWVFIEGVNEFQTDTFCVIDSMNAASTYSWFADTDAEGPLEILDGNTLIFSDGTGMSVTRTGNTISFATTITDTDSYIDSAFYGADDTLVLVRWDGTQWTDSVKVLIPSGGYSWDVDTDGELPLTILNTDQILLSEGTGMTVDRVGNTITFATTIVDTDTYVDSAGYNVGIDSFEFFRTDGTGWVDSFMVWSPYTRAYNGLTNQTFDSIKWGGTLVEQTEIQGDFFSIDFDSITWFDVGTGTTGGGGFRYEHRKNTASFFQMDFQNSVWRYMEDDTINEITMAVAPENAMRIHAFPLSDFTPRDSVIGFTISPTAIQVRTQEINRNNGIVGQVLTLQNTSGDAEWQTAPSASDSYIDSAFYGVDDTLVMVRWDEFSSTWADSVKVDLSSAGITDADWFVENTASTVPTASTDNQWHNGNIGIGDFSATTIGANLDIVGTTGIRLTDVTTDATNKHFIITGRHYTNAEEDVFLFGGDDELTANQIQFGGGNASFNAATDIFFYTGADNTTLLGTQRMRIDRQGDVGIGSNNPLNLLHLERDDAGTAASSNYMVNVENPNAGASVVATLGFQTNSTWRGSIQGQAEGTGGSIHLITRETGGTLTRGLTVFNDQQIGFPIYGVGTYDTGAETYLLGVETDGDVVEVDLTPGGGVVDDDWLLENTVNTVPTNSQNAYRTGYIGIGDYSASTDLDRALDIIAPNGTQFRLSSSRADATTKNAYMQVRHYLNAEQDVMFMLGQSLVTTNNILWGGGSGLFNAVTNHRFYTAANNTTVVGTERLRIDNDGSFDMFDYGGLAFTGTATSIAAFDVNGNLIEEDPADYLNFTGTANKVVYTDATGALAVEATDAFNYNESTNTFHTPGITRLHDAPSTGTASVEIGLARTGNGSAQIDFHGSVGLDFGARIQRQGDVTGNLEIQNTGAQINFRTNGVGDIDAIIKGNRQWQWPAYTSGTAFNDTDDLGVLSIDGNGDVQTMTFTELSDSLSIAAGTPDSVWLKQSDSTHAFGYEPIWRDSSVRVTQWVNSVIVQDSLNSTRILFPKGGAASVNGAGAIRIDLPSAVAWADATEVQILLTIRENSDDTHYQLELSGLLTDGATDSWSNVSATVISSESTQFDSISFGSRQTDVLPSIWLEDTSGSWTNAMVTITEVLLNGTNRNIADWRTGWNITLDNVTTGDVYQHNRNISKLLPFTGTSLWTEIGDTTYRTDTVDYVAIGHLYPKAVLDVRAEQDASVNTAFFAANQTAVAFTSTFAGFYAANISGTTNSYARVNFGDGDANATSAIGSQITNPAGNEGELVFWTRGTGFAERMRIRTTGQAKLNNYTTTTSFSGTEVGVLGYDNAGNILTTPFSDIDAQIGPYDNYVSWSINNELGTDHTINSGNTVNLIGVGSVNVTGTASNTVEISYSDGDASSTNELQTFSSSSNSTSHTVTLSNSGGSIQFTEGTAINLVTSGTALNGIVQINNTGDISNTNELQNLGIGTRTSTTYPITITSGTGATLNVFSSTLAGIVPSSGGGTTNFLRADGTWQAPGAGSGIYGGSGTVPTGTVATLSGTTGIAFNHNADAAQNFGIYNSSVGSFLRSPGSHSVFIGNATNGTDELEIDAGSGVVTIGEENNNTTSYIAFYENGNIDIQGGSGDIIKIAGTIAEVSNGVMFVGDNLTDQLEIETSTSAVFLAHELAMTTVGGASESYIQLDEDGDVHLRANDGTGDDLIFTANDHYFFGYTTSQDADAFFEVSVRPFNGVVSTWDVPSDERIKTKIEPIKDAYEKINRLQPVTYRHKKEYLTDKGLPDKEQIGWIAQEYQKVFPDHVGVGGTYWKDYDDLLTVNVDAIGPYTVAAVQQLIKDKREMETRIDYLEQQIQSLIQSQKGKK